MRMRKKKNLHPRMEVCQAYWITEPAALAGHWHDLMPQAKALHVELGCGKGRFTVETAKSEPEKTEKKDDNCDEIEIEPII